MAVDGDFADKAGEREVLVYSHSPAAATAPAVDRHGGKTAKNLTPRPGIDTTGLSMTTTPGRGWLFQGGKDEPRLLGFEVQDDPTDDRGHFLVGPGLAFVGRGWDLQAWAAIRPGIDESDRSTWHELTQILRDAAVPTP